jgi:hypothetical protein
MNDPPLLTQKLTCAACGFYYEATNSDIAAMIAANHTAACGPTHQVDAMAIVAQPSFLGQNANMPNTLVYAVPANAGGMYRLNVYAVVAMIATTSSTLPMVGLIYTDMDTNVSAGGNITPSNNGNVAGNTNSLNGNYSIGNVVIRAKGGTSISINSFSYASVPAAMMQYNCYTKLEYLGP